MSRWGPPRWETWTQRADTWRPPAECSPLPCDDALVSYPYALHFGADHGGIKDSQQIGTGFTSITKDNLADSQDSLYKSSC